MEHMGLLLAAAICALIAAWVASQRCDGGGKHRWRCTSGGVTCCECEKCGTQRCDMI